MFRLKGLERATPGLQILSQLRQRWSARAEAGWLQQSTAAERVAWVYGRQSDLTRI
jgi:hypothetical protein